MTTENQAVAAGQAVYTKKVLSIYDLWVLGFSNHYLWKCPTARIANTFSVYASDNHLDVGVGTGYYLKHHLPARKQRLALVDLNENSLKTAAVAVAHFAPETYQRNVLEPLNLDCAKFDSVSINYLLHCLPGNMESKATLFTHLTPWVNSGGVIFGSTILGQGVEKNVFASKLMALYNRKGIFSNQHDDYATLEKTLQQHFSNVQIEMHGCVAIFSATVN
ncbi:class I SAM-dependent methyltransferase [Vibrio navarrensis]|uniref:class I SAM-dependent methyltransferase n=1 Tax=Vibrio navarrensis TaxID=29495 RepID=UPI001869BB76|nr:class I SAM-dependent methyltransferase [Vibrio navarrensis]MBE4620101.1 methyltransferase type 12 [Vibrio navarrensis]